MLNHNTLLPTNRSNNRFNHQRFAHMKCYDLLKHLDFNMVPKELAKKYTKIIPNLVMLISTRKPHGLAMAKYIILVYDRQSPFVVDHRLLPDRKKAVLAFVGLNETRFEEQMNICLDLSDEALVDALSDYLRWQDNGTWSLIVQNEEVFYNNQKQVLQGVSALNKDTDRFKASEYQSKLLDINERIQKRIKSLWAELTGDDPDAEAKIKERKPLSPEVVAEWEIVGTTYKFDDDDEEKISDEEE